MVLALYNIVTDKFFTGSYPEIFENAEIDKNNREFLLMLNGCISYAYYGGDLVIAHGQFKLNGRPLPYEAELYQIVSSLVREEKYLIATGYMKDLLKRSI